jgi:hypothetical protein
MDASECNCLLLRTRSCGAHMRECRGSSWLRQSPFREAAYDIKQSSMSGLDESAADRAFVGWRCRRMSVSLKGTTSGTPSCPPGERQPLISDYAAKHITLAGLYIPGGLPRLRTLSSTSPTPPYFTLIYCLFLSRSLLVPTTAWRMLPSGEQSRWSQQTDGHL